MKKIFHKLLSSIVSLMLVVTASFVPELFNFSTANAVGTYQADSGVYDLIGNSTNGHTDAHYLWEHSGKIYVAFTVLHRSVGKINEIIVSGVEATSYVELPSSTNLYITDSGSGTVLLNQSSTGKVGSGYNWVVAELQFPTSSVPTSIVVSIDITGRGHSIEGITYIVSGALDVFHEYPPTAPVLDGDQSFGSNVLGGIAAGTYTFNPSPTIGYEYSSVELEINGTVIGTAILGTPFTYTFHHGSINVDANGVISLILSTTSNKE